MFLPESSYSVDSDRVVPRAKNAPVWILSSKESRWVRSAHSTSKAWGVWCLMISGQNSYNSFNLKLRSSFGRDSLTVHPPFWDPSPRWFGRYNLPKWYLSYDVIRYDMARCDVVWQDLAYFNDVIYIYRCDSKYDMWYDMGWCLSTLNTRRGRMWNVGRWPSWVEMWYAMIYLTWYLLRPRPYFTHVPKIKGVEMISVK